MNVEGVEIVEGISTERTPQLYYREIEVAVNAQLNRLNIIKRVSFERSITTNSVYLKVRFKECRSQIVVSIRTHDPYPFRDDYIYVFSYEYCSIKKMMEEVEKKIRKEYRERSSESKRIKYESMRESRRKKNRKRKAKPVCIMGSPSRRSSKEIRDQNILVQKLIEEINVKSEEHTNTINRSRKENAASEQHLEDKSEAVG